MLVFVLVGFFPFFSRFFFFSFCSCLFPSFFLLFFFFSFSSSSSFCLVCLFSVVC